MLLIPCPHCGLREESEFTYGGPCRDLPALDGQSDAGTWSQAFHMGKNPRGPLRELWYHSSGCEAWIEVTRDTASHEIIPGGQT
ncbi:sarcosine oxidase subunit delta [Leisingera sp. ANG-M1]|uniref:sarcosine oxidase subunit delta n=1 Tax=Leisingera sp. ANG-M1 TaxID=1577895 RepID=UPI00068D3193|nr:sarcosine oxidase subunit delta [Leisingera sp. ANG-M1]